LACLCKQEKVAKVRVISSYAAPPENETKQGNLPGYAGTWGPSAGNKPASLSNSVLLMPAPASLRTSTYPLGGNILVLLGLLDAVPVSLTALVPSCMVLRLGHCDATTIGPYSIEWCHTNGQRKYRAAKRLAIPPGTTKLAKGLSVCSQGSNKANASEQPK
jgi:hypothetical protein